jgi:hypothetical protein
MALRFRLHREDDLDSMKEMWSSNTDWGSDFEGIYEAYITNSCLEGSCILLAEDDTENTLVGQFLFLPYLVKTPEKELKAYRPAAPVVSKSYRYFKANPLDHPAIKMYMEGAKLMQAKGADLIFMTPNPSWVRLMKMFPDFQTATYPLFSRQLTEEPMPELLSEISFSRVDPHDPRIDRLWEKFRILHSCSVVRDTRILPWKIGKGDHEVIGLERYGELIAVLAMRAKGDKQWLIDDWMFADDYDAIIAALKVATLIAHKKAEQSPLTKVAVLATPVMKQSLEELGFRRDSYDFPFTVHKLSNAVDSATLDPALWFLSSND